MQGDVVYCLKCAWYRPWRNLGSWFGLNRRVAQEFSKCAHPNATIHGALVYISPNSPPKPSRQCYCDTQNPKGECPDFEPKEIKDAG